MPRTVLILAVSLTAVVVAYFALAWVLQRRLLFPAPQAPPIDPARAVAGMQTIEPGDGQPTEAWFLPPPSATPPYPAVVFAHGNGELIDDWASALGQVREWGFGVLLVEYPGYGRSPGEPTEATVTEALVRAYDQLIARPEILPDSIVGYGRSLGGGAICRLAAQRELAALVLESTFTGVRPLARRMAAPGWLVRDPFDNRAVLRTYSGPVLILHGTRDGIIPFHHAQQLHGVAERSTLVPLECGHNDCRRPWPAIERFLSEAGLRGTAIDAADPR